jgi:hypothetical protein
LGWNVPLGAAVLELPLEGAAVVVEEVVWALTVLPVNRAAPMAPPVSVAPTIAAARTAFRTGFTLVFSF